MSVTLRWAFACLLVLSLSTCVLADIILENEASAPVEAATPQPHSAMPVLNRLSQRIQESELKEKSFLTAKSSVRATATAAVYGAFADAILGSVWTQAYRQCTDLTLTTTQNLLTTYWNWNGVRANQGYIHIFDYMGENDKRALLRLRELATILRAAIVPNGAGGANHELRAYGALLDELLLPFATFANAAQPVVNYAAANTFVKPGHILDANFRFVAQLATLNAADGFLQNRFTQQNHPHLWAARAQMVAKVTALNQLLLQNNNNVPAGPEHFCTVFVGLATVVTAALHELHRVAATAPYSCTYETFTNPINNDVSEIVWVPSVVNNAFHFTGAATGVEIRLFNQRFSTFIPKNYQTSLLTPATNLPEINAQIADANNQDFVAALNAHVLLNPAPQNIVAQGQQAIAGYNLRGFRTTLNAAGPGRARVVTAATNRLTLANNNQAPQPNAINQAVDAALTAKIHRCFP